MHGSPQDERVYLTQPVPTHRGTMPQGATIVVLRKRNGHVVGIWQGPEHPSARRVTVPEAACNPERRNR